MEYKKGFQMKPLDVARIERPTVVQIERVEGAVNGEISNLGELVQQREQQTGHAAPGHPLDDTAQPVRYLGVAWPVHRVEQSWLARRMPAAFGYSSCDIRG